MKKYWAIFKITWQNNLEYRADFFGHMIRGLIYLVVLILIWRAVFSQVDNFGSYTFPTMLTYLVMTKFLHFTTRGNLTRLIAREIKEGDLSSYLIKPAGYLKIWFSSFWAERFFEALIRSSILFGFLLLLPRFFQLPSSRMLPLFFISLMIALLFNFLFNVFLASFAFWVTDVRLFSTAVGLTTGFLAGELIPVDIMPGILKSIAAFLPFQYLLYFPIKVYQDVLLPEEIIRGVLMAFIWLVVFALSLKFFWQRGLRHYEAIGQ